MASRATSETAAITALIETLAVASLEKFAGQNNSHAGSEFLGFGSRDGLRDGSGVGDGGGQGGEEKGGDGGELHFGCLERNSLRSGVWMRRRDGACF